MARLRASWRTSLPVVQQPRNPQSESIARTPYHWVLCWSTLYRWRGLAGSFKSPPLRTAIRPVIRASTRPCTRKSKRAVTADVLERLLHTCVLERFVDVRDHALLLLPLLPAGGATPSGCGQ